MAGVATPSLTRSKKKVLIASTDAVLRSRVLKHWKYANAQSEEALGGAEALAKLLECPCDNVLLDRRLPDLDAAEVAELIRQRFPGTTVEMVDADFEEHEAHGIHVCEKRGEVSPQLPPAATAENSAACLQAAAPAVEALPGMIGASRAIQQVYRLARMVAPRDTSVLITGETGTGKELVAQALHQLSLRARQPFVTVNCAAIPEALLEAELFGHARGAFTGAVQSRLGRIHVAHGGTLFLDEIGELPLSMQAKLLRFLQNGEVQRLGSADVHRVDVRLVCATNVRLLDLLQAKQFRQDLYYRLAVFPIALPPLRERAEDLEPLANHFLSLLSEEHGLPGKQLSDSAAALLQQSRWDGNLRELQHALERAFILSGNEAVLRVEHFQMFGDGLHPVEI